MKKQAVKNLIQLLTAALFLLAVWAVLYFAVGNELLVPSFSDCLKQMLACIKSGAFWLGFLTSFLRAVFAFFLSFVCALIFALVAYMLPPFETFFAPIVSVFRSMPVLAVMLILLSFLSAGTAPVAVAFLSLFPMLYTGILAALSGIDKEILEASRLHGASWWTRIYRLYLPLCSPYILRESSGALSFSLKLVISAEVLASTAKSLGVMMQEAKAYSEIPRLFALVFFSFLLGFLLEYAVSALAKAVEKQLE